MLFLAGLQDVPSSILEAAELDGASPWARFFGVTWPMLRPTTLFVATTSWIASFQLFDDRAGDDAGRPRALHDRLRVRHLRSSSFLDPRVGRASAAKPWCFSRFWLLLTAAQFLLFRSEETA